MSEIEVGEYIRTEKGIIGKFKGYSLSLIFASDDIVLDHCTIGFDEDDIKAHSKNIIDLIEAGDIVILEYYVSRYRKRIQRKFEVETFKNDICFLNHRCSFLYDREKQKFIDGEGFNIKIKSILTHEQYEQNCYKVGDIE